MPSSDSRPNPNPCPALRVPPGRWAGTLDGSGWLHTGDVGQIDGHGRIRIVDRKKDLIINSSGKNMSPANIEPRLRQSGPLIDWGGRIAHVPVHAANVRASEHTINELIARLRAPRTVLAALCGQRQFCCEAMAASMSNSLILVINSSSCAGPRAPDWRNT